MNAGAQSSQADGVPDWTHGTERVTYQKCRNCLQVWYFRRSFCPCCGDTAPDIHAASGQGTVHAVTVVQRAPTDALRSALPYTVALVDCQEGFRMLAHAQAGVRIGDAVRMSFTHLDGRLVPCFLPGRVPSPPSLSTTFTPGDIS